MKDSLSLCVSLYLSRAVLNYDTNSILPGNGAAFPVRVYRRYRPIPGNYSFFPLLDGSRVSVLFVQNLTLNVILMSDPNLCRVGVIIYFLLYRSRPLTFSPLQHKANSYAPLAVTS